MNHRPHPPHLYLLGLALLLGLSGCSSWFGGHRQPARVELVQVQVVKAKLLDQRFTLRFSIDNPNSSRLPVRGLIYRVTLGGILLSEGEADDWFSVAAHSKEYYEITVRTNLWEHLRDLTRLLKHPERPIPYRLDGSLKTGILFRHDLHLDRSGEIIPGDFIPE